MLYNCFVFAGKPPCTTLDQHWVNVPTLPQLHGLYILCIFFKFICRCLWAVMKCQGWDQLNNLYNVENSTSLNVTAIVQMWQLITHKTQERFKLSCLKNTIHWINHHSEWVNVSVMLPTILIFVSKRGCNILLLWNLNSRVGFEPAISYFPSRQLSHHCTKWNESGFGPLLCTYRLNWAMRTSWGWWDDWDDTVLQTQDSKFEPWRSEAEHATSRSRRPQYWLSHVDGEDNFLFLSNRRDREPNPELWRERQRC